MRPSTVSLNDLAQRITTDINAEIEQACRNESGLRWQTLAENIADERLTGEWEWIVYAALGDYPKIALTRYLK